MWQVSNHQTVTIWKAEQIELYRPTTTQIPNPFNLAQSTFDYVIARCYSFNEHVENAT
jgi:hypothetical protein